jgi:release factor glutamine methyltransferase
LNEVEVVADLRAAGCVFAVDEADLLLAAAGSGHQLTDLVRRRCAGEPLEQLLGWVEFAGRRLVVGPGVFVPRRRTELLARLAMTLTRPGDVVVELCCGVGAVAAGLTGREVHAADIDVAALRCAQTNLPDGFVHHGDLFDALPAGLAGRLSLIVANAPYVPTAAIPLMPPEAREHEPAVALDGGGDGLDVQRRILAGASPWLVPGGHLLIETSQEQAPSTAELFRAAGFSAQVHRDEDVDGTAVLGRRA